MLPGSSHLEMRGGYARSLCRNAGRHCLCRSAIGALIMSRRLPPLAYTAVHLIATLFMIMFVTCGYEAVPTVARTAPEYLSRLIYLGVSSIMFFNTILIHAFLNRSKKRTTRGNLFSIEP